MHFLQYNNNKNKKYNNNDNKLDYNNKEKSNNYIYNQKSDDSNNDNDFYDDEDKLLNENDELNSDNDDNEKEQNLETNKINLQDLFKTQDGITEKKTKNSNIGNAEELKKSITLLSGFEPIKTYSKQSSYFKTKMILDYKSGIDRIEGNVIKVARRDRRINEEKLKKYITLTNDNPPQIKFKQKLKDIEIRMIMNALEPKTMYYFIPKKTLTTKQRIEEVVIPFTSAQFKALQNNYVCDLNKKTLHPTNITNFKDKDKKMEFNTFQEKIENAVIQNFQYKHPYGVTNTVVPDRRAKVYNTRNANGRPVKSYVFNNFLTSGYIYGHPQYFRGVTRSIKQLQYDAIKDNKIRMLCLPISIYNIHHAITMTFAILPNGQIKTTFTNSNGYVNASKEYFYPLMNDLKKAFQEQGLTKARWYKNETHDQHEFGSCMQHSLTLAERIAKNPVYYGKRGIKNEYEMFSKAFNRMFARKIFDFYYKQHNMPIETKHYKTTGMSGFENPVPIYEKEQYVKYKNQNRKNIQERKNLINKNTRDKYNDRGLQKENKQKTFNKHFYNYKGEMKINDYYDKYRQNEKK